MKLVNLERLVESTFPSTTYPLTSSSDWIDEIVVKNINDFITALNAFLTRLQNCNGPDHELTTDESLELINIIHNIAPPNFKDEFAEDFSLFCSQMAEEPLFSAYLILSTNGVADDSFQNTAVNLYSENNMREVARQKNPVNSAKSLWYATFPALVPDFSSSSPASTATHENTEKPTF